MAALCSELRALLPGAHAADRHDLGPAASAAPPVARRRPGGISPADEVERTEVVPLTGTTVAAFCATV